MFSLYVFKYILVGFSHLAMLHTPDFINPTTDKPCLDAALNESVRVLNSCMSQKSGALDFFRSIETTRESFTRFIQLRCSYTPHIDNCVDQGLNVSKHCFNETQLQGIDVWGKIDKENVEYVCNNIDEIFRLLNSADKRCSDAGVSRVMMDCYVPSTTRVPLHNIPRVREHCSEIENMMACTEKILTQYCPKEIVKICTTVTNNVKNNLCPGK